MVGFYPVTIKEAVSLYADHPESTIFSGGTDLMVRRLFKDSVIYVNGIKELHRITVTDDYFKIGAAATYSEIMGSDLPDIIKEVASNVASPAIRNMGTMGGNICNASPAGDTLPMLYAVEAQLEISSFQDDDVITRMVLVKDFILGVRKINLRPGEILTGIYIPKKFFSDDCSFYYKKVGARKSEAISKLSIFGMAQADCGRLKKISIAFGSMGPAVVCPDEIHDILRNITYPAYVNKKVRIIDLCMEKLKPIDDQRSSAEYRKKTAENLLKDLLDCFGKRLQEG